MTLQTAIFAYAAKTPKAPLEPFQYEKPPLSSMEISVNVTHCGICHSDLHLIDNDWKVSAYPLVPGHEVVGIVEEVGKDVTHLQKGDRVGIGWQCQSCMSCPECISGDERLCKEQVATCNGHFGGYASHLIADSRFAFKLPENLPSDVAAPLLCGGITVFTPLLEHKIQGIHKVGVIGIGGLGHLALQFLNKFGCEVVALSTTKNKEEEAYQLGAHHFSLLNDPAPSLTGSLDFILSTANQGVSIENALKLLKPKGCLILNGSVADKLDCMGKDLVIQSKSLSGSNIGSRKEIQQMLQFAARHKVYPQIELFPMEQVNEALNHLRSGKARYRIVLKN